MTLSQADFDLALDHLKSRWKADSCLSCGSSDHEWVITGYYPMIQSDLPKMLQVRGTGVTFIGVTCSACGDTRFVNTQVIEGFGGG